MSHLSVLHRIGTYTAHSDSIIQLLNLGDVLLSLGSDRKLIVWEEGVYDTPRVGRYHLCTLPSGVTNAQWHLAPAYPTATPLCLDEEHGRCIM